MACRLKPKAKIIRGSRRIRPQRVRYTPGDGLRWKKDGGCMYVPASTYKELMYTKRSRQVSRMNKMGLGWKRCNFYWNRQTKLGIFRYMMLWRSEQNFTINAKDIL